MRKKTKNKIINHIMTNGEKKTSENILFKTVKKLQKNSKKQLKQIIQLAIINSTPTFKLHKIENKKQKKRNRKVREIPAFISKPFARTSIAVKLILASVEKKKSNQFYKKFNKGIISTARQEGTAIDLKNTLQKQVILKKHFFNYYRWK